jgi:hypothetical protein
MWGPSSLAVFIAVGDTRDFRLDSFAITHDAPLALFVIPRSHLLVFYNLLKRAVESVASLIISSAQSAAARYFVTGSRSHNVSYSGPERIPVRYVVAPALTVDQVRKRVLSSNSLGIAPLLLKCRSVSCVLSARKSPSSEAIS